MADIDIGTHGVVLLAILFVLLTAEDILIWVESGTVPAFEFFIALVLVVGVFAVAVREANRHPPPGK
jgi:predicted ferric reductase